MSKTISVLPTGTPNTDTNFQRVNKALENTISRDGSLPNHMEADLDMNSNDILNVNRIDANDVVVDGEDLSNRLQEVVDARDVAIGAANTATTQANRAENIVDGAINNIIAEGNDQVNRVQSEGNIQTERAKREADRAAGYVNDIVAEKEVPITATRNGIEALEFPEGMGTVQTRGYATIGDSGAALYVRVDSEPDHTGSVQDASGQWWEITGSQKILLAAQYGLFPEMSSEDTVEKLIGVIKRANELATNLGTTTVQFEPGTYLIDDTVWDSGSSSLALITADNVTLDCRGATFDLSACEVKNRGMFSFLGEGPQFFRDVVSISDYSRKISVADVSGFALGDAITVHSQQPWNHLSNTNGTGQIAIVEYIGDDYLYLSSPLMDDYDLVTYPAVVAKLHVVRGGKVIGGTFIGEGTDGGRSLADADPGVRSINAQYFYDMDIIDCTFKNFRRFAVSRQVGMKSTIKGNTVLGRDPADPNNAWTEVISDPNNPVTQLQELNSYSNPWTLVIEGSGSVTISGSGVSGTATEGNPLIFNIPGSARGVTFTVSGNVTFMSCSSSSPEVSRWFTGFYDNGVSDVLIQGNHCYGARRLYDCHRSLGIVVAPFGNAYVIGRNIIMDSNIMGWCGYAAAPHVGQNFIFTNNLAYGLWQGGYGYRGVDWTSANNRIYVTGSNVGWGASWGSTGWAGTVMCTNDVLVSPEGINLNGGFDYFSFTGGVNRVLNYPISSHAVSVATSTKTIKGFVYAPQISELPSGSSNSHVAIPSGIVECANIDIAPVEMIGGDIAVSIAGGPYAESDTTCSATSGSNVITVASAADIVPFRAVVIANANSRSNSELFAYVVNVDGNNITLDRPVARDLTNETVKVLASLRNVTLRNSRVRDVAGRVAWFNRGSGYMGSNIQARDLFIETKPAIGAITVSGIGNFQDGRVLESNIRLAWGQATAPLDISLVTAADLGSASHVINTVGKYAGKVVMDTTNNRLLVSSGSGSTSGWVNVASGVVEITPA